MTRRWIQDNDLSNAKYFVNKSVRFKTLMLRSDLCNYSDACNVPKGRITVRGTNDDNRRNKNLIFRNNAPFRSCISKNAENLHIVMPIYNLLEYSENFLRR